MNAYMNSQLDYVETMNSVEIEKPILLPDPAVIRTLIGVKKIEIKET